MFDKPYEFSYLGKKETLLKNPKHKIQYRFKAKCRTYLVTLECYSFDVVAVKYCDVKDRGSKNAYIKIFDDLDAFRVISTCLYIMRDYWSKNKDASFVFYATPRKVNKTDEANARKKTNGYKQVRYTIYKYAMVNKFDSKDFTHLRNSENGIYILVNKRKHSNVFPVIYNLTNYLKEHHNIIFERDED